MQTIQMNELTIKEKGSFTLISGPCVMESETVVMQTADTLKQLSDKLGFQLIFKSSFDKANRSSIHSYRGPGIEKGLKLLEKVKKEFKLPVLTDIHTPEQAHLAKDVCDVLQIPAFLCRQTDLLVAAAQTGKVVNIKKGQFLAPWDMKNPIEKVKESGNHNIIVTERGYSFGYNNLVSDMRSIPIMQQFGFPVCFDATHSVQLPGGESTSSGGQREHIIPLAKAAIAAGANLLFMESHPNPEQAKSDQKCQIPLDQLSQSLAQLIALYSLIQEQLSC